MMLKKKIFFTILINTKYTNQKLKLKLNRYHLKMKICVKFQTDEENQKRKVKENQKENQKVKENQKKEIKYLFEQLTHF